MFVFTLNQLTAISISEPHLLYLFFLYSPFLLLGCMLSHQFLWGVCSTGLDVLALHAINSSNLIYCGIKVYSHCLINFCFSYWLDSKFFEAETVYALMFFSFWKLVPCPIQFLYSLHFSYSHCHCYCWVVVIILGALHAPLYCCCEDLCSYHPVWAAISLSFLHVEG